MIRVRHSHVYTFAAGLLAGVAGAKALAIGFSKSTWDQILLGVIAVFFAGDALVTWLWLQQSKAMQAGFEAEGRRLIDIRTRERGE